MKKLILTDDFKQTQDVVLKEGAEPEKITPFALQTMKILNSGQLPYKDMAHYKRVRKAVKDLMKQKAEPTILFEDSDYREIFGTEDNPGILRQFGGWMSFESTDDYISIWENAENSSIQVVKSLGKVK